MMEKLQQGDRFPALTLSLVGGGQVRIPDDLPGRYAAVLFYRGHW
jgi:peroxiredoxin